MIDHTFQTFMRLLPSS